MEKYSSGRRGSPAKGVGRATGARVQIPPSPPINEEQCVRIYLKCPKCGHEFSFVNYIMWVLKTPFHLYSFKDKADCRKTICPNCGKKSWMKRQK